MKEAFLHELRRFLAFTSRDDWTAEDPEQQGIGVDLDCANVELGEPFTVQSCTCGEGVLVLELTPSAAVAEAGAIESAVYRLLGLVAENNVFIHRRIERDRFVFDVAIGETHHGHFIRLIVHAPGLEPLPYNDA